MLAKSSIGAYPETRTALEFDKMRPISFIAALALSSPTAAWAQYRDMDAALAGVQRGFASGDVYAIIEGIPSGEAVRLEFPGYADASGVFGRDQTAYALDSLFNRVKPEAFQLVGTKANRARREYVITARWRIAGRACDLYVTLRSAGEGWTVAALRAV